MLSTAKMKRSSATSFMSLITMTTFATVPCAVACAGWFQIEHNIRNETPVYLSEFVTNGVDGP